MGVRIIVDSTADIAKDIESNFTVVPMTVHFGEDEYIDGVTIDHKRFYEMLIESDVLPKTSQATPESFIKYFDEVKAASDSAVVITLASSLSGTYQSACIAADDYEDIWVVDSESVAIGTGILAELALRLANDGLDAQSIAKRLEIEKKRIRIVAMVDTLEYLQKGGRVSKTVAFAGGLLNIKPVLSVAEGKINMLGKARGSKQGNNLLVTEIANYGGVDFSMPVLLGYTGLSDILLQKYIEDSAFLWEHATESLRTTVIGSVIGTHVGPGAVAVAFFKN